MFTYVRTEVNYTEEVDDPVDSDGERRAFTASMQYWFEQFSAFKAPFSIFSLAPFLQARFWVLRIWCSASLSLSTRCWRTTSSRARWRKPCPNSSTTSSCTCRSPRTRWGVLITIAVEWEVADMEVWAVKKVFTILFPQIKAWTTNPQQFVEDEDDDTFSYSVRISAQDLLLVRY